MKILGVKYLGHEAAASIMVDGELVACCEEERYSLEKHTGAFPVNAIKDCLDICGLEINQVDQLAVVGDYHYKIRELYLKPALQDKNRVDMLINDIDRIKSMNNVEGFIRGKTGYKGNIQFYRHHLCHLASAYYPSGFDKTLLLSLDGLGEVESTMWGVGDQGAIEIHHDRNHYPDSIGLLYSGITDYLGWKHHCDEGIIMGLASFGRPHDKVPSQNFSYYDVFAEILRLGEGYEFSVDFDWMGYYATRDKWVSGRFLKVFGSKRKYEDAVTQHHKNIAAALQLRMEDMVISQLKKAKEEFGVDRLALAGGVALNCSMNGRILKEKIFDEIFVQPASGDQGCSVGACYLAHFNSEKTDIWEAKREHDFYKGSRFSLDEYKAALDDKGIEYTKEENIYTKVAQEIYDGKIVGWMQGSAEFGPRALGNRSILCRPFPESMRDHINNRVKFREEFRPFAPAVLEENAKEYFALDQVSPHMLIAVQVRQNKKDDIPAVVHVDGSCRVQTVNRDNNAAFYELISEFNKISSIPVLLNTSFNVKGQPIVNTPMQAIECFLSTNIDCLVLGDYFVTKE